MGSPVKVPQIILQIYDVGKCTTSFLMTMISTTNRKFNTRRLRLRSASRYLGWLSVAMAPEKVEWQTELIVKYLLEDEVQSRTLLDCSGDIEPDGPGDSGESCSADVEHYCTVAAERQLLSFFRFSLCDSLYCI